jgi:hypothetical protein
LQQLLVQPAGHGSATFLSQGLSQPLLQPGLQFFEVLHGSQPLFLQPVVVAKAMANVSATAILPSVLNMERFM